MPARSTALLLLGSLALLAIAGCAAAGPSGAPSFTPIAQAPRPTPVPRPTVSAPQATPTPAPTRTPVVGDVDGETGGPELTIEDVDADTIQATIADPDAKAWRLVISGTGALAGDRWEILVETGDVEPLITATEVRDGAVVDVMDLTGFGSDTAAAGGCHSTLPVCLDSEGFSLPADGDGTLSIRLELPEAGQPLSIRGGTAGWPAEPFILGPWTETEAFSWGS